LKVQIRFSKGKKGFSSGKLTQQDKGSDNLGENEGLPGYKAGDKKIST